MALRNLFRGGHDDGQYGRDPWDRNVGAGDWEHQGEERNYGGFGADDQEYRHRHPSDWPRATDERGLGLSRDQNYRYEGGYGERSYREYVGHDDQPDFRGRELSSARNYSGDVYANQMRPDRTEDDYRADRNELGEGFERRGWRSGSDYYGSDPERYGAGNYDAGAFGAGRYGNREYIGDRSTPGENWEDTASGYGGGDYGSRNYGGSYGQSFSDRWQDSYGGGQGNTREPGQFRGRGPKGYRRSDERIREDVCECLTADDHIDASNIDVTVRDCEVTLSGTVSSREAKRRAEDLIERISGVKDVNNSLRVAGQSSQGGQEKESTGNMSPQTRQGARH